jgi:hypothetical protein
MPRPDLEVSQIFRHHGQVYRENHRLSPEQHKAMRDIERCRTAHLGGHMDFCSHGCGYMLISYNSCRNRHCPKCQSFKQARWLEARLERLLPTHYFHLVVTLPHELNPVTLLNPNSSLISSLRPPPGPCYNLPGTTSACGLRSVLRLYCTPGIRSSIPITICTS